MNILVTGGASGLGGAITKRLADDENNNNIYFTYNQSKGSAEKIESDFNNTTSIKCDFRNPIEIKAIRDKIKDFDLDVLINNAFSGDFLKTYFHKVDANDFLDDFQFNIMPVIEITQESIISFRKKKFGKIITILSSALVNIPPIGSSVYIANKAYLEELTKVWANENAKFNITSNSISPALMLSNLTKDVDERVIDQIIENHPLKKLLTFEEVAETVLFLVNASSQINGIDIIINAGVNVK